MHHPNHRLSLSYSGDQSPLDGWCLLHLDIRVKDIPPPPPGGTELGVVLADFIYLLFRCVATLITFVKRIKCFTNYGWLQLI